MLDRKKIGADLRMSEEIYRPMAKETGKKPVTSSMLSLVGNLSQAGVKKAPTMFLSLIHI